MRVLVTGSKGKLASFVIPRLQQEGLEVRGVDIKDGAENDLRVYENCLQAVDGCEQVLHFAGLPHPAPWPAHDFFKGNVLASANMLQAALEKKVHRFIYSSSSAFFGTDAFFVPIYLPVDECHPPNMRLEGRKLDEKGCSYPGSKRAVEMLCQMYARHNAPQFQPHKMEVMVLRLGPLIERHLYFGIKLEHPSAAYVPKCLFTHSDPRDMGDAFYKAVIYQMKDPFEVFHVMNRTFPEDFHPFGITPLEWVKQQFPDVKGATAKNFGANQAFFSSEKAINELGWEPQYS